MKRLKFAILWVIGAALSYGAASALHASFANGGGWWWLVAWVVAYSAALVLQIGFIANRGVLTGLVVLEGLVPLAVFYPSVITTFSPWVLAGFGACILCFVLGALRTRSYMDGALTVQFFSATRVALPKIGTGLILLFFALAYNYYVELGNFTRPVAERMFDKVLQQAEPIVQIAYSNLSFNMGMAQAIDVIGQSELRKIRTDSLTQGQSVTQLTPQEENAALKTLDNEIAQKIAALGGPVQGNETLGQYIFNALAARVAGFSDIVKITLAAGFGVLLFVLVRFTLPVTYPIAGFLAFAVFKLLLLTPFADIALKDTKQQVIAL